jgi:parvulin-like peptidyl-prolyl isomerase
MAASTIASGTTAFMAPAAFMPASFIAAAAAPIVTVDRAAITTMIAKHLVAAVRGQHRGGGKHQGQHR